VTTADENLDSESSLRPQWSGATKTLSVRQLVAELARAEDALRARPDDPEPAAQVRVLVRELRRRAARVRLQAQLIDAAPRRGGTR